MRIEFAVGADEAIVVEVLVIIAVPVVVVAGIGKDFHTVGIFLAESLVYEVPDETTLVLGVLADDVPVLLEVALAVAHSVGILTLEERLLGLFVGALTVLLTLLQAEVHGAVEVGVGVPAAALPMYGTAGVELLDPFIGILEVHTLCRLVAE